MIKGIIIIRYCISVGTKYNIDTYFGVVIMRSDFLCDKEERCPLRYKEGSKRWRIICSIRAIAALWYGRVCPPQPAFIVSVTENTECQAFFPVVRTGSPLLPHPQGSVAPPPLLDPRGQTHSLAGEEWGDPIPTKGQTLWYSMYTIISLRFWFWGGLVKKTSRIMWYLITMRYHMV